jgi:hypothetical protein
MKEAKGVSSFGFFHKPRERMTTLGNTVYSK